MITLSKNIDVQPFALICGARTGSSAVTNFFRDMNIHLAFEPFRPSKAVLFNIKTLETIYFGSGASGIKHLYDHLSIEDNVSLIKWLIGNKIPIVHLRRRSKVHNTISHIIAQRSHVWSLDRRDPELSANYDQFEPGHIDVELIKRMTSEKISIENSLDQIPYKYAKCIFYEDLFSGEMFDVKLEIASLFSWLGIHSYPDYLTQMILEHFSQDGKQNKSPIFDRIVNKEEIENTFGVKL